MRMDFFSLDMKSFSFCGTGTGCPRMLSTVSLNFAGCAVSRNTPVSPFSQIVRKPLESAGSVRVEYIAVFPEDLAYGFPYLSVSVTASGDVFPYGIHGVPVHFHYPCEVARVPDIHGIGYCLYRRSRLVSAGLEVFQEYVVPVVCRNEPPDRKPHPPCYEPCRDIAEIPARDTEHHVLRLPFAFQLCIGIEIVESLRKESCHIYGIGRCESEDGIEFFVHECGFDETLAVVEIAGHFKCRYILSECGELLFLYFAHLPFRVQDNHVYAFHPEETVCHCTARVSGRGDDDGHFPAGILLPDEV